MVIVGGLLLAPLGLPILPPRTLATYVQAIGAVPKLEKRKSSPLRRWFADRFEGDEFIRTTAVGGKKADWQTVYSRVNSVGVIPGAYGIG